MPVFRQKLWTPESERIRQEEADRPKVTCTEPEVIPSTFQDLEHGVWVPKAGRTRGTNLGPLTYRGQYN